MSAQPCGCDPDAKPYPWVCAQHNPNTGLVGSWQRLDEIRAIDPTMSGNGEQTGFSTGASRSTDADKIDYEGHINPEVLAIFGEYMHAHRVQRDGRIRGSDNWQRGIPVYRYVKSLIRHTFEFWRMWRGHAAFNPDAHGRVFTLKEVLSAILFNVMGIIYELERRDQAVHNDDISLDKVMVPTSVREALEREEV